MTSREQAHGRRSSGTFSSTDTSPSGSPNDPRSMEALLSGIVSIAQEAILSIDEQSRVTLYNEGAARMFGWTEEEMIGQSFDVLIPARYRERHRQHVKNFGRGSTAARQMGDERATVRGLRKNGEEFPAQASISKIVVDGAVRYTVILRDVTEELRVLKAQEFLAEVGAVLPMSLKLDETLDNIARLATRFLADCCFVAALDQDGHLDRWHTKNVAGEKGEFTRRLEAFGEERVKAYLKTVLHDIDGSTTLREITPAYVASIEGDQNQVDLFEGMAPCSWMGVPLRAHGHTVGAMFLISANACARQQSDDVWLAEQLATRAALALSNARFLQIAEQATRSRDDVLAVVAHDLRNPLAAAAFAAENLTRMDITKASERATAAVRTIARSLQRADRLIEDLLDVARLEGPGVKLTCKPSAAGALIRDAFDASELVAAVAQVVLRADACDADTVVVLADRDRVLQVFTNLITNAVKFTPAGKVVRLGARRVDREVVFSVADEGSGIAPEHVPHLFDRFWQARSADRRGAGLGLAIAKGIVTAHGGRIWVESAVGAGSTFYFTLPIVDDGEV